MSFNQRLRANQQALAATAATGVIGTQVVGNPFPVKNMAPGTSLAAKVTVVIVTGSVTLTPSWQGSQNGSSWEDLYGKNNAANVALSASGSRSILLEGQPPYLFVRAVATVGGASATSSDTVAMAYHYLGSDFPT